MRLVIFFSLTRGNLNIVVSGQLFSTLNCLFSLQNVLFKVALAQLESSVGNLSDLRSSDGL